MPFDPQVCEEIEHEYGGTIKAMLVYDDDPLNPRDADNLATMVCWHRRYDLGDRQPEDVERRALERGGFALLERYLRMSKGAVAFTKLGLLDHSGLTMWAGGGSHMCDPGGWDSGTVGFAYVTHERCRFLGCDQLRADEVMLAEIREYDLYLRGECYGLAIEDDGEVVESLWGCLGYDYAVSELRDLLKEYVESTHGIPMEVA